MRHCCLLICLVIAWPVSSAESFAGDPLTLNQALINVLEQNPDLKVSDYATRAAIARISAARQTPPMQANLTFENFAGSGNLEGTDAMETTLSLSKIFELGDKAERRAEVAKGKADLLQNSQDAKRLDILAEAARRFVHVVLDQHRLNIAQEMLALTNRTFNIINKRVAAGRSPVAEKRRIAIAVERARIELEHAEHELLTSRLKLATMWSSTNPAFSHAQADLFQLQSPGSFDELAVLLEHNPDLVRFATSKRLAEANLHLARTKQNTNLEMTAGLRHFSSSDDDAFVFSASIPFGLDSRAEPYIEAQQLELQKEPFDYEKQKLSLYSTLYGVYQEMVHAYTASNALRQKIIPDARKALRDYEKGYAVGRYSFLELTDAQQLLLEAEQESVMAAANYHRHKIEIDRLTGVRLSTGVNQ